MALVDEQQSRTGFIDRYQRVAVTDAAMVTPDRCALVQPTSEQSFIDGWPWTVSMCGPFFIGGVFGRGDDHGGFAGGRLQHQNLSYVQVCGPSFL